MAPSPPPSPRPSPAPPCGPRRTSVLLAVLFPPAGPSEDGRRGWRIAALLLGAGLPRDFSVSALCLEDDSASVPWCMRTSRRRRLSAEWPRLWRGYLKPFCFFCVDSHDSQLNKCDGITWLNPYESPYSLCKCTVKEFLFIFFSRLR